MQMKSGKAGERGWAVSSTVRCFSQFSRPEEVKMQKVSYAVQAAISLVAFITHAKNVRVGKQCNSGEGGGGQERERERGWQGQKGNVRVCLRCLLEIHDCLAHTHTHAA